MVELKVNNGTVFEALKEGITKVESELVDMSFDLAHLDPVEIDQMVVDAIFSAPEGPHLMVMWREYFMILRGSDATAQNCGNEIYVPFVKSNGIPGQIMEMPDILALGTESLIMTTYRGNITFLVNYEVLQVF